MKPHDWKERGLDIRSINWVCDACKSRITSSGEPRSCDFFEMDGIRYVLTHYRPYPNAGVSKWDKTNVLQDCDLAAAQRILED